MSNPVRSCLGCGQRDDHPRHTVVIPPDMAEVPWHMDCHAAITNCELCVPVVKGAKGKTGDTLRTYIIEKG
jgi:putative methionine-R-sulfoxide reductase with GAF domain